MEQIKILQIGLSYNPGGIESFVMNYDKRLKDEDICFDFINIFDHIAYEDEIKKLGGRIYQVSNIKKSPKGYTHELASILAYESGNHYAAVHVNMLSAANLIPLFVASKENERRRAAGVKELHIIAHSHNSNTPSLIKKILHKMNRKKVLRLATDYWACSKMAADWLFGENNTESNIHIVNNAIHASRYQFREAYRREIREEFGFAKEDLVLLHVGRMDAQKNHTILLEIFEQVRKLSAHRKVHLLMVGEGDLEDALKEQAKVTGIIDDVYFCGIREDVNKFYSAGDIFVFPSLYEGLSLTMVEAQASGIPIIASTSMDEDSFFTDNCRRMPLSAPLESWGRLILQLEEQFRGKRLEADNDNRANILRAAGFDIKVEEKKLAKMYRAMEEA